MYPVECHYICAQHTKAQPFCLRVDLSAFISSRYAWPTTDKPKALKRDMLFKSHWVRVQAKGFRHLFTFTIKALTYTDVPARLAHFTHSASIF